MTDQPPPRRSWAIVTVLCLIAACAVTIAVSASFAGWRHHASGPEPVAPGLAALSDDQLAALLPHQRDFPEGWTIEDRKEYSEGFGYSVYHASDPLEEFTPGECATVTRGASMDTYDAADVSGKDPADPEASRYREDIELMVGREYNPTGFDDMIALVSRCVQPTSKLGPFQYRYTVQVLEDSHPPDAPQRFRYAVTTDFGGPDSTKRVTYYSYARMSRLILSGSGSEDHQQVFDTLFGDTLGRISSAHS